MTATDPMTQQAIRLHKAGKNVQHIARACGKTVVAVQQILEQQLGERPGKGRKA